MADSQTYLFCGEDKDCRIQVKNFIKDNLSAGPPAEQAGGRNDFLFNVFEFEGVGVNIEEAREIKRLAYLSPVGLGPKFIVIYNIENLSKEAASTLLKIFEEVPKNTIFIATASFYENIEDTLRSRMIIMNPVRKSISKEAGGEMESKNESSLFLKKKPAERINFINKLLDDRNLTSEFLDNLLKFFQRALIKETSLQKIKIIAGSSEEILKLRAFYNKKIIPPKAALEYLAVILPPLED